ncbi:MAG: helix-turn-helix transcriptional regulator [Oscillospiraceae bacterium]
MEKTIGKKLFELRKQFGLTQDLVAEKLGVSPQAVSKWENDLACPDIMLLPQIAKLYSITVDELFTADDFNVPADTNNENNTKPTSDEKNINKNDLFLKVLINSKAGDDIKVTIPFIIVKGLLDTGKDVSKAFGANIDNVDFTQIIQMVENGAVGELVNITSQSGDIIRVVIE